MKAMILAAGIGTRMGPVAGGRPKPMVNVAGRPMLEYIVEQIRDCGITDIYINLHHLPEKIREHFRDGKGFGVRITYSEEETLLGTAGAVKKLESHFKECFLVYYGDNYVEIDLKDFIQTHKNSSADCSVAVFPCENPEMSGILQVDENLAVLNFIEKPPADANVGNLANAGIYLIEPGILSLIPDDRPSDFGHDIFPQMLERGKRMRAYLLRGTVIGIDTPNLHARLEAYLSKKSPSSQGERT